jgi:hypothetical protein
VLAAGIVPVVWVNLHAGELFGVAMIFACAVLLLVRHDLREGGWCLAAGAVALAASFLNPYGVGVLEQAAQVQSASSGVMVEWQHLDPGDPLQLAALAVGLTALILAVRRRDLVFTGGLGVAAAGSVIAIRPPDPRASCAAGAGRIRLQAACAEIPAQPQDRALPWPGRRDGRGPAEPGSHRLS